MKDKAKDKEQVKILLQSIYDTARTANNNEAFVSIELEAGELSDLLGIDLTDTDHGAGEPAHNENEFAERLNAARAYDDAEFYGRLSEKIQRALAVADLLRCTETNSLFPGTIDDSANMLCDQLSEAEKDLDDWKEQRPVADLAVQP